MSPELAGADSVAAQLRDAASDAASIAAMTTRLRGLARLLLAQGLKVVIRSAVMTVSNPTAVETDDPHAVARNRRPAQSVVLQTTDDGLFWCWVRHAPSGLAPELETLCPGDDVEQAARRIAQALADADS